MEALDFIQQDFADVFTTEKIAPPEQPYASLAPSAACYLCMEMTMSTRLVDTGAQVNNDKSPS